MRFKNFALALALVLIAGPGACRRSAAHAAAEAANPAGPTTLRVVNQRFLDMTVYVLPQVGARLRLGTATGNSTTMLTIPSQLIFGTTQLRFVADPIGGPGASLSQSILVTPGDQVTLTITP